MRLSKFIQDHMEELLREWESFAQTLLPSGKTLNVHNHGPSIPEPKRARIFEPLLRVAETSSPVISTHMGLGLYVVREIVQAHGGAIDLESTESGGTTFTITLPRQ
jgi:signal transduction histidine kinase